MAQLSTTVTRPSKPPLSIWAVAQVPLRPLVMGMNTRDSYSSSTRAHSPAMAAGEGWAVVMSAPSACRR